MYHLLAILAVAFLASGGLFVKLSSLGPITTGFYRVFIALLTVLFYEIIFNKKYRKNASKLNGKTKILLMLAGASLGCDLVLWNISMYHTTIANANLLVNLVPLFSVPLSYILFKEKVSGRYLSTLALAFLGVVILIGGKISITEDKLLGDLLAFISAFFYSIYLLMIAAIQQNIGFTTLVKYVSIGASIILLFAAILFENHFLITNYYHLLPLLGLAFISHIAGQGLLALAMRQIGILILSMIVLTQTIFAAFYGYVFFYERLTIQEIVGMMIILSAIYLTTNWAKVRPNLKNVE